MDQTKSLINSLSIEIREVCAYCGYSLSFQVNAVQEENTKIAITASVETCQHCVDKALDDAWSNLKKNRNKEPIDNGDISKRYD